MVSARQLRLPQEGYFLFLRGRTGSAACLAGIDPLQPLRRTG
jgi:hypothetical protein